MKKLLLTFTTTLSLLIFGLIGANSVFADCNQILTNSSDIRIGDLVGVVVKGCSLAADQYSLDIRDSSGATKNTYALIQNSNGDYTITPFVVASNAQPGTYTFVVKTASRDIFSNNFTVQQSNPGERGGACRSGIFSGLPCDNGLACINNVCSECTNGVGNGRDCGTSNNGNSGSSGGNSGSSNVPTNTINGNCGNDNVSTAIGCIPINDTNALIGFFLKWGIGIGGGIAFLLIVVAGFQIMTSRGDPNRLKAGQELMTSAIAGLLMLIFSLVILRIIGFDLLGIPAFM